MKSVGRQKRKAPQNLKENNEQAGGMHKKYAGRIRKPLQEAAGASSVLRGQRIQCPAPCTSGQTVLDQGKPLIESACDGKVKIPPREHHLSAKIKLQLFPVHETTRLRLEKDGHNPFLELTLSSRKKISSVIKHLISKWGNSWEGPGELALLPHNMQLEKLGSCRRWTLENSSISAGELYSLLESPKLFRLWYGWFSGLSVEASGVSSTSSPLEDISKSKTSTETVNLFSLITGGCNEKLKLDIQETPNPTNVHEAAHVNVSEQRPSEGDDLMTHGIPTTSPVSWEDSFTSLSIGGLLSEASLLDKINKSTMKPESMLPALASDISIGALLSETIFKDKLNNSMLKSENKLTTKSFTDKSTEGLYFGPSCQDMNNSPDSKTVNEIGFQGISMASGKSTGDMFSNSSFSLKTNIHSTELGLQPCTDSKVVQSAWDDGLTTLSIGGLLSEASLLERIGPKAEGASSNSKNQMFTFDSFDGFISSQNNSHPQHKSLRHGSSSSILDGEVTCHAFDFRKLAPSGGDLDSVSRSDISEGICKKNVRNSLLHHDEESSLGIKGIKWNDSRGPFDLGLPMVHPASGIEGVSRLFK